MRQLAVGQAPVFDRRHGSGREASKRSLFQHPNPDTGILLGDLLIITGPTPEAERIAGRSKASASAGGSPARTKGSAR